MVLKVNLLTLTAVELQRLLSENVITSRLAVQQYLEQIDTHNYRGLKLNAVISVADRRELLQRAQELDEERQQGNVRGPLHGVPIIIKDICTTLGMPSTCGSYAFKQGKAKIDAPLISTLTDNGMLIIAKANLSELGNAKGEFLMAGWSPCLNPHVDGDIPDNAPFSTHWGPAGSSSGSATSVAAGFAPLSLGTELEGSITWPAARAGLYAIKLTPGTVDQAGFQPGATGFDCQGPFAKTTVDVAMLSAVIQRRDPSYYLPLSTSWDGLRVGIVDPKKWRAPAYVVEQIDAFFDQQDAALYAAQDRIEELGAKVVRNVPLPSWEEIAEAMPDLDDMGPLFTYQMKTLWPAFLALWDGIPQTIEGLIEWNKSHRDLEFTARNDNQKGLEAMRDCTMTEEVYSRNVKNLRKAARDAVQRVLDDAGVDMVLGPCDSRLNSIGAAAGFPVGNLPLGHADFNGRGFSLHAIAPAGEEKKILQVMSAWEATFPNNVCPPRKLVEWNL